jgi:iron complex outermembrane receptor protein
MFSSAGESGNGANGAHDAPDRRRDQNARSLGENILTNSASLAQPGSVRGTRAFMAAASFAVLAVSIAQPVAAQDASPNQATAVEPAPATVAQDVTQPQISTAPVLSEPAGQDIVVTGSRISRRDYQANSPIVTVDDSLLEQASTASVEANLNKLPQFTPANGRTPTTSGGDIQPTSRNSPGSANVSLRGIGANRTLVLINGRRATPSDATGTVDINTIPSAAIERVEIISGGASSTYGADAVAGVTNFILKSKFTGLEIDGQAALTERGDGFEYNLSGIMGTDFADSRGNISLAFQANERKRAYNRNRDFYKDLWANPNITGTGFFPRIPGINLGFANSPTAAAFGSVMPGLTSPIRPNAGVVIYANPDGSAFSGFDAGGVGGVSEAKVVDGYNYKRLANGQLSTNFTDALTQSPLTRYNMFAQGNYEVTDNITAFAQANFSNTHTEGVQEPAPVTGGWSAQVPYNSASPQANLPQELRTLLNSRPNPNAPFQIFQMLPFNRTAASDVYSYNMTAGIRGSLPFKDWTYELFGSQGKTQSTSTLGGFGSLQRYRTIISAPNFGQGFRMTGNPEGAGFGASTATCTTGLNPFGGAISNDCLEAIKADVKTKSVMHQTIWEGDVTGTLFTLPAGDLKTALGASYRSNNFRFENDTLTTQGRSFLEQSIGLYPSGNSRGKINVSEFYGELLIPVLKDIPFIQELNLEVGGRLSDYNTTGNSYTYKILGDWKINDYIRVRGGYNRAERAPNVAELFLAPEQTFAVAPGGDVCSRLNGASYSANPGTNPTNAARVEALCRVLMARTGPNGARQFYDSGNVQPTGPSFVFPTLTGNANLKPETADTWTAGVVLSSPFESAMLRRLRLTVDYYNIKVNDAIGAQSVDIAQRQCFDTAFNPTLDANSPLCSAINRNDVGSLGNVLTTFLNNGRFRTSGIDATLDWSFPVGPGQFNLNSSFNYLLNMKSAELASLPLVDYAGTLGPSQNGLNGGSYEWRLFTTVGYSIGGNSLSLQWRHLPSVDVETKAIQPNTPFVGYPAYDMFNLLGSVAVNQDLVFRFGVENLLDKAPPLGNINTAPTAGNLSGGAYNAQFYDVLGRRFYIGAKAKF